MTVSSASKRIDQGRAKYAYECVEEAHHLAHNDVSKAYKSYSKRLLTLIKNNGLGNALAFILSKAKDDKQKKEYAYQLLYNHIQKWLKEDEKQIIDLSHNSLIKKIITVKSDIYRLTTIEVLILLRWITRFADGMIEGETDD